MPLPPRIAILVLARSRLRLPAELNRCRRCPLRSAAPRPSCCEPSAAAPEGSRRTIADDASRADGGRRSRSVLAPPFPSRISRPGTQSHRVMPPLFPSSCNGFEVVDGRDKRSHAARQYCKKITASLFAVPFKKKDNTARSEANQRKNISVILARELSTRNTSSSSPWVKNVRNKIYPTVSCQCHSTSIRNPVAIKDIWWSLLSLFFCLFLIPLFIGMVIFCVSKRMALNWMLFRENSSHCAGGILADEQGLGKTVVVIALILKERAQQSKFMSTDSDRAAIAVDKEIKDRPVKKLLGTFTSLFELFLQKPTCHAIGVKPYVVDRMSSSISTSTLRSTYTAKPAGGTLLVCPKCILTQWEEELSHKVTKDATLSVLVYHGCLRTMNPEDLAKYDVVITTYGIMKQLHGSRKKLSDSDSLNSKPIAAVRWFRVVLDEAHEIRNRKSLVAKVCWQLEGEKKWCLSGTPMQDKFGDLYSYFCFLSCKPYSEYRSFCFLLKKQNSTYASLGKTKLEILLGALLLQRTKETLINGEPIIKLPTKTIQIRKIFFTPEEQDFYLSLDKGCQQVWMEYDAMTKKRRRPEENPPTIDDILKLLKELQLACDHPCLVKSRSDDQPCSTIFERNYVSSKMKAFIDILNSILNKHTITKSDSNIESSSIESPPEKILVFSQFTKVLDLLQPLLNSNGIQFRRLDGKMDAEARDKGVKDFKTNPEVTVLLVSLKAGSVGLNLAAAAHAIIVDPWWNPFLEDQAIGRAHRIGQTRPVTVHRLVAEDTIEERILALQNMKRRMVERVLDGNIFREKPIKEARKKELSKDDLRFLIGRI